MTTNPELLEMLLLDYPILTSKKDGFLDIINMQSSEVINSSLYSYFLNQHKNPELSKVFFTALIQLIELKSGKNIAFATYDCTTEVVTASNKRIDILITSNDRDYPGSIIIENKIYHYLNNDLEIYWNHRTDEESQKAGVYLTLYNEKVPEPYTHSFHNITHLEWIDAIKKIGLPPGLSINEYVYVNDFIKTIEELSMITNTEMIDFYLEHSEKIARAEAVKNAAQEFTLTELSKTASGLGLKRSGNNGHCCYFLQKNDELRYYYTIIYENLFSQKQLSIIIELYDKGLQEVAELDDILRETEAFKKLKWEARASGGKWMHYLSKDYVLEKHEIKNLSNFVRMKINEDFFGIMSAISDHFNRKSS